LNTAPTSSTPLPSSAQTPPQTPLSAETQPLLNHTSGTGLRPAIRLRALADVHGSPVQSAGPGALGMRLVDLAPFQGIIPLIPFVLAGWLLTEGITGLVRRRPHDDGRSLSGRRVPPVP